MDRINSFSLDEVIEVISGIIESGNTSVSTMVHGTPGCGKSAVVAQIASSHDFHLEDVRLSAMESSDVMGIPYVDSNGEMRFSTPSWFPKDGKPTILFLDELSNAPVSTFHAAYRLIHDRTISNGKRLPDNCFIIAAGNYASDKTGAKEIVPALANRMIHLHVDMNKVVDGFLTFIVDQKWNRTIVGYLNYKKENISNTYSGDPSFASSRSWEKVNMLYDMGIINKHNMKKLVASAVGTTIAIDYSAFAELNDRLPNWKELRTSDAYQYDLDKSDASLSFSLSTALAFEIMDALVENKSDETKRLVKFLDQFSDEIKIITLKTFKRNKDAVSRMGGSKELLDILKQVAKYISK